MGRIEMAGKDQENAPSESAEHQPITTAKTVGISGSWTAKTKTHEKGSEYLTTAEACDYANLSRRQLETLRQTGGGPVFHKIGRRTVRYLKADIDSWLAACRRTFTQQEA